MKNPLNTIKKRNGFTLIETLISVMLISVVVTAVFGLALTSKAASKKTGRRAEALFYTRQIMERLKAYNTADQTLIGPGMNTNWAIPQDQCSGCTGGAGACWALDSACTHDVTGLLPTNLRGAPVNMTLDYSIIDRTCGIGKTCKEATFTVYWDE